MGMANTQGLKNYVTSRMNVDTAYMANFIEGLTLRSRKPNAKVAGIQCRIADSSASRGTSHPGHRQTDSRERLRENPQPQPLFGGIRQDAGRPTYGYELAKAEEVAQKQMKYYHDANMERKYGDNRRAGEAFLKANAKRTAYGPYPRECNTRY